MEINLELYKIFYYVAITKNLTKASQDLHISQPAITKHIKNLEEILNVTLFIRTKRGVILTEVGEIIFEQAKNIMNSSKNIENIIHSYQSLESGTIKIGSGKNLVRLAVLPILKKIQTEYPNINLEFIISPSELLNDKLKNGEIDLIISKFPKKKDEKLLYDKLGCLHNIFICNNNYPELINKEINVELLKEYPLITTQNVSSSKKLLNKLFDDNNIKIKKNIQIGSFSLITKFVEEGYGIGVVTKEFIKDNVSKNIHEIKTIPALDKMEYGIITLKDTLFNPATKIFIEYLKTANN